MPAASRRSATAKKNLSAPKATKLAGSRTAAGTSFIKGKKDSGTAETAVPFKCEYLSSAWPMLDGGQGRGVVLCLRYLCRLAVCGGLLCRILTACRIVAGI